MLEGLHQIDYVMKTFNGRVSSAIDKQDLIAEAVWAVMDAVERKWDPARGVKFKTFTNQVIRGAILNFLKRQKLVRVYNESAREKSIAEEVDLKSVDNEQSERIIQHATLSALDRGDLLEADYIILELHFFRGQSWRDIATNVGIAPSTVGLALDEALVKLRDANFITKHDKGD